MDAKNSREWVFPPVEPQKDETIIPAKKVGRADISCLQSMGMPSCESRTRLDNEIPCKITYVSS